MIFLFDAPVWVWDARKTDVWTFVSLPVEESADIRTLLNEFGAGIPRGFGAVRVTATIGATTWRTSIFPSKDGAYVLPLKKAVRKAEGLAIDDVATVKVELDV